MLIVFGQMLMTKLLAHGTSPTPGVLPLVVSATSQLFQQQQLSRWPTTLKAVPERRVIRPAMPRLM